jgi:thiol-disulfide isomerase/thioredoxin
MALLANTALAFGQKKGMVHLEAEYSKRDFDAISIVSTENNQVVHTIKADAKGLFKADFKLPASGEYIIKNKDKNLSFVFLKNEQNLSLKSSKADYFSKEGSESFQGSLSPETIYYATFYDRDVNDLYALNEAEFKQKLAEVQEKHLQEVKALKNLDAKQQSQAVSDAKQRYSYFSEKYYILKLKGTTLPDFKLESMTDGQLVDFSSFKGKYVLIDVWATWCSPCIRQMPSLKLLEEKLHGKNIAFVGISIDKADKKEKAKEVVAKQQLSSPQFFAHPTETAPFIKHMRLSAPPRFMLIGPDGKVVDPNTVYPSDPELGKMLDELLK